jgi:antitoxin HicB
MNKNPRIGESFESFLRVEGICDEVAATVVKRTLALQIEHEIAAQNISVAKPAPRMKASKKQSRR